MVNIKPLKIYPCIKIFCVAKSSLIGLLFLFTMAVLAVTTTRCSGKSNGNENKDVNECLSGNGGCDINATCTHVPGQTGSAARTCACNPGYSGDGLECIPISLSVDCSAQGACSELSVAGDAPATTPGLFKGFADPTLVQDLDIPGRRWLTYTWPHIQTGQGLDGKTVYIAATSIHLARSDDSGISFTFAKELWPAVPSADPEASGQNGILNSEVASLAAIRSDGTTTWFGSRQRYFQQALTGYNPKYSTSWIMRIAAASSPDKLTEAPDTVLGVSTAAPVYSVDVYIDQLAGLPIQRCAMLNNPALFTSGSTLYLVLECLAFIGQTQDFPNNTVQIFATEPQGTPSSWQWRYVGKIADYSIGQELGSPSVKQPNLSLSSDGKPLLLLTYGVLDSNVVDGIRAQGCVALELSSIEPPMLRRNSAGGLVVRAKVEGNNIGACTHATGSSTGILATRNADSGGYWTLVKSGLDP